jgi:acetyl esterase/lipase
MAAAIPILERRVVYRVPGMDRVDAQRSLVYRSVAGAELTLDLYRPAGTPADARLPVVVFIHGGPVRPEMRPTEWGQYRSWGELVAASGLAAVTLNHRYYDYGDLAQAGEDVAAAIEYVRGRAGELGLDAERLCLWACSGGGLLLSAALRERPAYVRCLVAYYAVLGLRGMPRFVAALGRQAAREWSPALHLANGDAAERPILVARAGLDDARLNRAIDRFALRALAANAPLELMNHPRGRHAFDLLDDDPRSREIIARTLAFMRGHLGCGPQPAVDPAYLAVLAQLVWRLSDGGLRWALTGSLSHALQGLPIAVHDIDVQTDAASAYEIERRFAGQVTRPVRFAEAERIRSHYGALAIDGIAVEIMGDIETRGADGLWVTPPDLGQLRRVVGVAGLAVPVLALEHEIEAYRRLGRHERAEELSRWLAGTGAG